MDLTQVLEATASPGKHQDTHPVPLPPYTLHKSFSPHSHCRHASDPRGTAATRKCSPNKPGRFPTFLTSHTQPHHSTDHPHYHTHCSWLGVACESIVLSTVGDLLHFDPDPRLLS